MMKFPLWVSPVVPVSPVVAAFFGFHSCTLPSFMANHV
jgi:hypothetical protein